MHLYLDERGGLDQPYYFFGGITLAPESVAGIAAFVRRLKRSIRSDIEADEWYLKGSGKHLVRGVEQADDREAAFRRWNIVAEMMPALDVPWTLHAATVLTDKFREHPDVRSLARADQRTRLYEVGAGTALTALSVHGPNDWNVYIDNVEGAQHAAFDLGVEAARLLHRREGLPAKVVRAVVVPKDDYASETAQILQFVDTVIYAVSRFILPEGTAASILANFEVWPYLVTGRNGAPTGTPAREPTEDEVARYFKVSRLYHYLRAKVVKNLLSRDGCFSSMVLVGTKPHFNFAHDFDNAVWKFCNTMWSDWEKAQLFIDFSRYE